MAVSDEVYASEEEGENDRHISLALKGTILLQQRDDERVGQIRSGELKSRMKLS